MEKATKESTIYTNEHHSENQSLNTLRDEGELTFRRLQSKEGKFYQTLFNPVSILQRKHNNNKFIILESQLEHQLYKIENHKLIFVSHHRVEIPVTTQNYFRGITEHHMRYFFKKSSIEKRTNHLKFFEEKKIDWNTPSLLVFELEYGIGKPKVIKAQFVGEMNLNDGDFSDWGFKDMYDNQKALFNRRLSLVRGVKKAEGGDLGPIGSISSRERFFLAEFGNQYKNLIKPIFRFNLKQSKIKGYQDKVLIDKSKVLKMEGDGCGFFNTENKFYLENWEPGKAEKLKPFIKIEREMIIVGLIDFRKRIIPVKGLVSVFELINSLQFRTDFSPTFFNIVRIDYWVELDMLVMDSWLNFGYRVDETENLKSVVEDENEEGRRKLALLNARRFYVDQDGFLVSEVKRVRFKVFGMFSKPERRVEAETLCYTEGASFTKSVGVVTSFEEDRSSIRVKVLSKGAAMKISSCQEQKGGEGVERNTQREVKEENGVIRTSRLNILKKALGLEAEINAHGVKSAFMVDEDHLLITTSTNLLLYDIHSSNLLSTYEYSLNVPVSLAYSLIHQNIMVSSHNRQGYLQFLRITLDEDNSPKFETLGIIYLRKFKKLFHSITKLLGFRKISGDTYDVKAKVKVRKGEESNLIEESILSLRLELPNSEIDKRNFPRVLSSDFDFSLRPGHAYLDCKTYFKNNKWNHVFLNNNRPFAIQIDIEKGSLKVFANHSNLIERNRLVEKFFLKDNLGYFYLRRENDMVLQVIDYHEPRQEGEMIGRNCLKTLMMDQSTKVYFDAITELFRIFVISRNLRGKKLLVLDEELEEVLSVDLPNLERVVDFNVISEDCIHLVGREYLSGNGETEPNQENMKVSLIVNLAELSLKRLVVEGEGEGPLFGVPHNIGGGRFLAFTRDYDSMQEKDSSGIYVSMCLN